ncbi:glycosyltransferase [bacterium]|nr:glycosyltransferase [bacterium]
MSKTKILTLSDHPLSPSGVGTQTKYFCESLLKTGRYSIISLGGAMKHNNYNSVHVEPYGEDWKIIPVDGYGTQEMIRSVIRTEKIQLIWFMTDPRFWSWLWEIENEIRPLCPMVYHHVWDNYPAPYFNRDYYLSNDHIVAISKVTDQAVRTVAPEVTCTYLPHSVNPDIFKPLSDLQIKETRERSLQEEDRDKVVFFWNNRNARRKQSGTLIWWFKEWLDKEELHDKACLIMHTEPKDPHGQDLEHIINHLGLKDRQILLSTQKIPPEQLAELYNMVDCTINISDAEGFGLATLESLSCGTPIIATMTGGLQEQVTDGETEFGVGLYPRSKSVIGSQQVPYIYEDRIDKAQFHSALNKIYKIGKKERRQLGTLGREHVEENYNFHELQQKWVEIIDKVVKERRGYNGIRFKEIA